MKKLLDHFPKHKVYELMELYGIEHVEEAQKLTDAQIMRARGLGLMFVQKLRRIEPDDSGTGYYRDELNKLMPWKAGTFRPQLQLRQHIDNREVKTKWLELNKQSAEVIIEFLKSNYL